MLAQNYSTKTKTDNHCPKMFLVLWLITTCTKVKIERKKQKETRVNDIEMQAAAQTRDNSFGPEDRENAPRGRSRTRRSVWYNE
jgi:hypothetical protein